jgi:hypothetical protein
MPAWLSPFSIAEPLVSQLQEAGWSPWPGSLNDLPADGAVLYDTPDRCFGIAPASLLEGYQQLLQLPSEQRVLAIWRLLGHEPESDPLATALTHAFIQAVPGLLDAYLDVELKADLLGGEPDVAYRRRLGAALQPDAVIQAWSTLQDRTESEALREQLEQHTKAEQDAREEAELTLLQLHQVQEELEHYFLLSRGQSQQLARYGDLQRRSHRLLAQVARHRSRLVG